MQIASSAHKICLDFQGWHIWSNIQGRVIANGPDESNRLLEFSSPDSAVNWFYMTGRHDLARAIHKANKG